MAKSETYFLAFIGVAVVAILIMILYMMSLQTSSYNTYGSGYGGMMGSGYSGGGMMGAGYAQQGGMMGDGCLSIQC